MRVYTRLFCALATRARPSFRQLQKLAVAAVNQFRYRLATLGQHVGQEHVPELGQARFYGH